MTVETLEMALLLSPFPGEHLVHLCYLFALILDPSQNQLWIIISTLILNACTSGTTPSATDT